jgi:hypothetical protein
MDRVDEGLRRGDNELQWGFGCERFLNEAPLRAEQP